MKPPPCSALRSSPAESRDSEPSIADLFLPKLASPLHPSLGAFLPHNTPVVIALTAYEGARLLGHGTQSMGGGVVGGVLLES